MVKKASTPLGEDLHPAIIYREDIEDIYGILSDLSKDVMIKADGYIFDNLDELFSHSKLEINELEMWILEPSITIRFEPWGIFIFSGDNTSVHVGAYVKIKSIVEKRRNLVYSILNNHFLKKSLSSGVVIFLLSYLITKSQMYFTILIGLTLIRIIMYYYSHSLAPKRYSQIILAYQKDKELSFFKRRKDELILAIIGILASAIIAYIFQS